MAKSFKVVVTIEESPPGFLTEEEVTNFCVAAKEDYAAGGWKLPHTQEYELERPDGSKGLVKVTWEIEN